MQLKCCYYYFNNNAATNENTMNGTTYESQGTTEIIETTKSHNGFNYALMESIFTFTMTGNKKTTSSHFECNCSVFKTEQDVIDFIDEIA